MIPDRQQAQRAVVIALLLAASIGAGVVIADFLSNSVPVTGPVPIVAPDGPNMTLTGSADVNLTDPWPDANTVELNTSEGNITFISVGPTNASIAASEINGSWTNVTEIDNTSNNELQFIPEDKPAVNVSGNIDNISVTTMTVDDGQVDFVYGGSGGTVNVTLRDLPANTELTAVDPNEAGVLDVASTDGNGKVTFELPTSTHQVELLDVAETAPNQTDPSPANNTKVTSEPSELSIDINDSDFPEGDEVDVNISLDGTEIHSETLTSNGTVTTSNFNDLDLGEHNWTVNTTDAYGLHANQTYSFELPSNVTFRNESNATQIITGVSLTATFYSTDGTTVIQKTDTDDDGNVSLSGLPNTEFVIVIEASGFYTRRVYIESIFDQQNVYLLNSTAFPNAKDTTFVYEDRTGEFDREDTTLRVQRALDKDGDGTFNWTTVAGDFWGAAGEFPFTGETNARYRLIIENAKGTQRIVGTHIPTADGTKNIIVGQLDWPTLAGVARDMNASLEPDTNSIRVVYQDPAENTSEVRVEVWELGNETNELYDQNFTGGPYGTLSVNVTGLTDDQTEMSWVVFVTATTDDDGEVTLKVPVGSSPFDLGIDQWLLGSVMWVMVTFVATLYGPRTAILGAWVLVFFAGIVMVFQFVTIPTASLIGAGAVAAGGTFYREAMP